MKAYWFSRDDGTTINQRVPAEIGRTDTFDGVPVPCECGLHSSPTPWDALQCAHDGTRLWEVEIPGDAVPHGYPVNKYAATRRTYLRCVDLALVMREFACRQAESVLPIFEKAYPTDKRPREAIEAARAFIRGEIDSKRLDASWAAARAAAWAADWDAARDAARAADWDAATNMFNAMALEALGVSA